MVPPSLPRRYAVSVVGYTRGVASPPSNTLLFVTPPPDAPLNSAVASSSRTVVIKLAPPALPPLDGGAW